MLRAGQCPWIESAEPYSAEDARGLLKAAIRDPESSCIPEQMSWLYGQTFELSAEAADKDFVLPIGRAKIERSGTDVTIVGIPLAVGLSLESSQKFYHVTLAFPVRRDFGDR